MTLIECPECKGNVSSRASACPHCGFEVSKYVKMAHEIITCPKCGSSEYYHSGDKCCICGTEVVNTHKLFSFKFDGAENESRRREEAFEELKSMGFYDPEYHKIVKMIDNVYTSLNPTQEERDMLYKYERITEEMRERDGFYNSQPTQSQPEQPKAPIVKCPNCGSTNTQRISTTSRVAGVLTLGLASGSIGKQYKCKACKYKW